VDHAPGFLALVDDAKRRVRETTPEAVRAKQEAGAAFHLVDVREDGEWAAGHAAGAVHLGKGIIERDIERTIPDRDAEIVLYCGGGFRSARALHGRGLASLARARAARREAGVLSVVDADRGAGAGGTPARLRFARLRMARLRICVSSRAQRRRSGVPPAPAPRSASAAFRNRILWRAVREELGDAELARV
jgi:rhodanese-related sulfurtransferase